MIFALFGCRAVFALLAILLFGRAWNQRRCRHDEAIFNGSIALGLIGLAVLA